MLPPKAFIIPLRLLARLIALPTVAVLVAFSLRRTLFALAILFARRDEEPPAASESLDGWPDILILVPCRDEEGVIAGLCQSLDRLDYPREKQRVVLIDDGSRDATRHHMQRFADSRPGWSVLALPETLGKSSALNVALSQFPFGEVAYVLDADHRPQPHALSRAVRYFRDGRVAGVSGRLVPSNPLASPSAYYSTVEGFIHQMVTMRAKDRLELAPALLGSNCCYRRAALARCGGFRDGALLEDTEITLTLYRAGYRVRFAQDVTAYHQVPETIAGYFDQHRRWARGFNDAALNHTQALLGGGGLSLPLRVELALFAAGYFDRVALFCAGVLAGLSLLNRHLVPFPCKMVYLALLMPVAQIVVLFAEQRVPRSMWLRLPLIPLFFLLDVLAAIRAMADSLSRRARVWTRTARRAENPHEGDGD